MSTPFHSQSSRYTYPPLQQEAPQKNPPLLVLVSVLTFVNTFLLLIVTYLSGYTFSVVHRVVDFVSTLSPLLTGGSY